MAPLTSRDLLDHLLEGNPLSADELNAFISVVEKEDLFADYKDGKLTGKTAECRQVVREWVSGFANAEGGVLILGVSENKPRKISACQQIGTEALDVWAQKVLSDMVGFFSPQPRFHVVQHPEGEVLLIAVARAPQLVPCIESRETKYFLRFHDSTREVPPYLISDLVLGRRNHPVLTPDLELAHFEYDFTSNPMTAHTGSVKFQVSVSNSSFVFADDVEFGMVGWTFTPSDVVPVGAHLRSHVDVEAPIGPVPWRAQTWKLMLAPSKGMGRSGQDLTPFDTLKLTLGAFWVPRVRDRVAHHPTAPPWLYCCALYVLAAGSPPVWFQIDLTVADRPIFDEESGMTLTRDYIAVKRLHESRPLIAWREKV